MSIMNRCATFHGDSPSGKKSYQSRQRDRTFGDGRFCVQLCIETPYNRAISVAHLTNFSSEFLFVIFTEDAYVLLLYHGAKSRR